MISRTRLINTRVKQRRRVNAMNQYDLGWVWKYPEHYGLCSFDFALTDVRLLVMWRIALLKIFVERVSYYGDSVRCSCFICTNLKRKWYGNGMTGKPMNERRQLAMADGTIEEFKANGNTFGTTGQPSDVMH